MLHRVVLRCFSSFYRGSITHRRLPLASRSSRVATPILGASFVRSFSSSDCGAWSSGNGIGSASDDDAAKKIDLEHEVAMEAMAADHVAVTDASRATNTSLVSDSIEIANSSSPSASSFSSASSAVVDNSGSAIVQTVVADNAHDAYAVTQQISGVLESVHNFCGLPWWATLVLFSFTLRTCLLPINIRMLRGQRNQTEAQTRLQELQAELKVEKDPDRLRLIQAEYMSLARNMINMWPFVQMPIFIGMFVGLRNLAKSKPEELIDGGALWFVDLSVPDPYYILPLSLGISTFLIFRIGADGMPAQKSTPAKIGISLLSVFIGYVTMSFPAALHVYWAANNAFSIGWTLLVKNEGIRKMLSLPPRAEMIRAAHKLSRATEEAAAARKAAIPTSIQFIDERSEAQQERELPPSSSSLHTTSVVVVNAESSEKEKDSKATTTAATATAATATTTSSSSSSTTTSSGRKRRRKKK